MATRQKPRNKKPMVILDSNALFVPLRLKIDIFEAIRNLLNTDFEPVVLLPVKRELEKLATKGSPQKRREAAYALKLTEKCKIININNENTTPDDAILQTAQKLKSAVFTNDKELRKKLRDINTPVVYVRQKSRLEIDGRL